MPRPDVALPQAAVDHMPAAVQDKLPDHLQDNFTPPFTGNVIWDNPSELEAHIGTTGEQDVFVFDLAAAVEAGETVFEFVDNFEVDLDVIAFINVPAEVEVVATFNPSRAAPKVPPGSDISNDDPPETVVSVGGDEPWAYSVWVLDTPSEHYVAFAADDTVTLQNGDIVTLGAAPDWMI